MLVLDISNYHFNSFLFSVLLDMNLKIAPGLESSPTIPQTRGLSSIAPGPQMRGPPQGLPILPPQHTIQALPPRGPPSLPRGPPSLPRVPPSLPLIPPSLPRVPPSLLQVPLPLPRVPPSLPTHPPLAPQLGPPFSMGPTDCNPQVPMKTAVPPPTQTALSPMLVQQSAPAILQSPIPIPHKVSWPVTFKQCHS